MDFTAWLDRWDLYLLVTVRATAFVVAIPLWGRGVPALVRAGLGALLAAVLVPGMRASGLPTTLPAYLLSAVGEALVGLALAFVVVTAFTSVLVAGQLVDVPLGFGVAQLIDPHSGLQGPVLAQLQWMLTGVVFFSVDGHQSLLRILAQSLVAAPPGHVTFSPAVVEAALQSVAGSFMLGVQLGLPVAAAMFLIDVALGVMSRAVPQVNVFVAGFAIKIVVALLLLTFALPALVAVTAWAFGGGGPLVVHLTTMLRGLAP